MADFSRDPLAPLFAEFRCDAAGLLALPPAMVEDAVRRLGASPADSAKIYIALAGARPPGAGETDALKTYFLEKERREQEPWRHEARRAETQIDSIRRAFAAEGSLEILRSAFLARAKAGTISAMEAVCLQYCLFGPDPAFSVHFLASLLLFVPAPSRLLVHNWGVAAVWPEARREAHGAGVVSLSAPLFPEAPGFDGLNARLLADAPVGGGPAGIYAPPLSDGLWSRPRRQQQRPPPYGAGSLAIRGPAGEQTAELDTTPLEGALATILAEIRGARGRGRGRGRGYGQAGHYPQHGQNHQQYQQQAQGNYQQQAAGGYQQQAQQPQQPAHYQHQGQQQQQQAYQQGPQQNRKN